MAYSMEERVPLNFRAATAGVVDMVALERDHVTGPEQEHAPVVISVASSGIGSPAVDEAVGDCYAVRGACSEDDVLAADAGCLYQT